MNLKEEAKQRATKLGEVQSGVSYAEGTIMQNQKRIDYAWVELSDSCIDVVTNGAFSKELFYSKNSVENVKLTLVA